MDVSTSTVAHLSAIRRVNEALNWPRHDACIARAWASENRLDISHMANREQSGLPVLRAVGHQLLQGPHELRPGRLVRPLDGKNTALNRQIISKMNWRLQYCAGLRLARHSRYSPLY
eukprot:scaffold141662_cov30-Prasinocladus_malaysianus.AAC.2